MNIGSHIDLLKNVSRVLYYTHFTPGSSVALVQSLSCVQLCDPMDCSTPGLPVHPQHWSLYKFMSIESVMPSAISSFVVPFYSCLQSFPTSGSFPMNWFFTSDSQSIGASASTSVLPMNIQGWFPLGLIGLISLQCKGLLRTFSNTTVQKHQLFSAQLSLWPNSHIHT